MKFMVRSRLKPGSVPRAIEAFETRGPNRSPGVSFRGAWVDSHSELVFVLVDSAEESLVRDASRTWGDILEIEIHPVVEIEQF